MTSMLQRDSNAVPIQSLIPVSPVSVATSGSSQSLAIPANTRFIRVSSTTSVWFEFGNASVTATTGSLLFPAGVEVFPIPEGATHIACLQVGAQAGYFSINRMK